MYLGTKKQPTSPVFKKLSATQQKEHTFFLKNKKPQNENETKVVIINSTKNNLKTRFKTVLFLLFDND